MKGLDRILLFLLFVVLLVLLLILWRQGIFPAAVFLIQAFMAAVVLGALYASFSAKDRSALVAFTVLCALIFVYWVYRIGTFTLWADGLAALLAYGVAVKCGYRRAAMPFRQWALPPTPPVFVRIPLFLITFWLLIGVMDWFGELPEVPSKTPPHNWFASRPAGSDSRKVALALSGGGYRAALLHAGVVEELEHLGIAPDIISSVSGGSILADALQSGLTPTQFVDVIVQGKLNLTRAVASPTYVFPALLDGFIPWDPIHRVRLTDLQSSDVSRTTVNAKLMALAWGQVPIGNAGEPVTGPAWIIGTTDIRGSQLVAASPEGTLVIPIRPWSNAAPEAHSVEASIYGAPHFAPCRLNAWFYGSGTVVAASAGFPLAFEPIITNVGCSVKERERYGLPRGPLELADGGLIDNRGVVMLVALAYLATQASSDSLVNRLAPSLILASDGGSVARKVGISIRGDYIREFDGPGDYFGSIGAAADLLYSYSGAPFTQPGFTGPRIINLSPQLLLPLKDPTEYAGFWSIDVEKLAARLLALSAEDLTHFAEILAPSREDTAPFVHDLKACVALTRNSAGAPKSPGSVLAECLGQAPFSQPAVFRQLNALLNFFVSADTLSARYSQREADALFRLGRLIVVLEKDAILREISELHPLDDSHAPPAH